MHQTQLNEYIMLNNPIRSSTLLTFGCTMAPFAGLFLGVSLNNTSLGWAVLIIGVLLTIAGSIYLWRIPQVIINARARTVIFDKEMHKYYGHVLPQASQEKEPITLPFDNVKKIFNPAPLPFLSFETRRSYTETQRQIHLFTNNGESHLIYIGLTHGKARGVALSLARLMAVPLQTNYDELPLGKFGKRTALKREVKKREQISANFLQQLINQSFPDDADRNWKIKSFEHLETASYIELAAVRDDKSVWRIKLVTEFFENAPEVIGAYSLKEDGWHFVFGRNPKIRPDTTRNSSRMAFYILNLIAFIILITIITSIFGSMLSSMLNNIFGDYPFSH